MLKSIVNNAVSTAAVVYNHSVAAVQTIADDEIKEAWKHRQQQIKDAKEQFNLTVKDVFKEKYEKINLKSKKRAKTERKRLAKSAA